jgi:hypothetical protein
LPNGSNDQALIDIADAAWIVFCTNGLGTSAMPVGRRSSMMGRRRNFPKLRMEIAHAMCSRLHLA